MDILTLGKMNQMAKDVDATLEYLANTTFETLRDVCSVQADIESVQSGQVTCLQDETQLGVDALISAGGSGGGAGTTFDVAAYCRHGSHGCMSLNYGGCSHNWNMPAGTKELKIELYGAGAAGNGHDQHCCTSLPGGAGAYAYKVLKKDDGDFLGDGSENYVFCAGGTGCCWPHEHNQKGNNSYATGPGLSNFCAQGGHQSADRGGRHNCYTCCGTCFCSCYVGADYGMHGRTGYSKNSQYCSQGMFQVAPGAPGPLGNGDKFSVDGCVLNNHISGTGSAPGGGGWSHITACCYNCCCGSGGGGGLVMVTYW